MDVESQIQNAFKREDEDFKLSIGPARQRLEALEADYVGLQKLAVPTWLPTIRDLTEASGHNVIIEGPDSTYEGPYSFKDGKIETSFGSFSLVEDGIRSITDKSTGKKLFDNPYSKEKISYQFALLFGKTAGIKEIRLEIDAAKASIEEIEENHKEVRERLRNAQAWIERGEKLIYPQNKDGWEKYVTIEIDLYKKAEMEKALDIMELMSKDGKIEDAIQLFNELPETGIARSIVTDIVTTFSKRGPEFYREVTQTNPKWVDKIEEKNQRLEQENQQLERDLAGGEKQ